MLNITSSTLGRLNTAKTTKEIICRIMSVRCVSDQGKLSDPLDDVILDEVNNAGLITLNRPKALNALDTSMIRKIYPKLQEWNGKKKVIVIKGSGQKAFCAGGDVKSITVALNEPGGEKLGTTFFREEYTLNYLIGTYKSPYVALINGITMGGGVGLSVHGRYRVATETTLFAMPETAIGLVPDVGGTYFLPKLRGKLGYYLGLTGHRLKGIDVLKAGVATHYVPSDRLEDLTNALLQINNEDIDNVIKKYQPDDLSQELSLAPYLKQIDHCFSAPTVEEIYQRLESDGSEWAQNTLKLLAKMSPTSLKVTLEAIEAGSRSSLAECLQTEFRLAYRSLNKNSDFYEGVRALLVDKDQKPVWKPTNLREILPDDVKNRFSKLPADLELVL